MHDGTWQRGVHWFSRPGIGPRFKWSAIVRWLEDGDIGRGGDDGFAYGPIFHATARARIALTARVAEPYSSPAMPCSIRVRDGFLVYRLRHHGLPGGGYESQERTALRDTPTNREKLEARAASYQTKCARTLSTICGGSARRQGAARRREAVLVPAIPTMREYAEQTWLPRKVPPLVRAWAAHDYRKHLKCHILPAFGTCLSVTSRPRRSKASGCAAQEEPEPQDGAQRDRRHAAGAAP